jgi:hypothetical protein
MWTYWFLFLFPAWLAITKTQSMKVNTHTAPWNGYWWIMFLLLVLIIGLRHEVGTDWGQYLDLVNLASYESLSQAATKGEPAYSILNWLSAWMDLGPYFVNTVCAALFAWGVIEFCKAQPRPWLALVVAVPYLVTVVAMGYTRQGVAIGLVMLGLVALSKHKILGFIVFVILAATFHRSSVIILPIAILAANRNRWFATLWLGIVSFVFSVLLLQEYLDALLSNYVEAGMDSAGATIRVVMNAVPAVLFLLFRKRFRMPKTDRIFWTWMSFVALVFVGLLLVSPSSTAVDRIALFWIPLQLFVLSRFPDAMCRQNDHTYIWICAVVGYSAAVMLVWLLFAIHAKYWIPYQFFPWVWLWN